MIRLLLLLLAVAFAFANQARAGEANCSGELDKDHSLPLFVPIKKGDDLFLSRCLHFTKIAAGRRTILLVWGSVSEGDSERFRAAIEQSKPIEEVDFFSPGGSLEEGLQIGRIVRAAKLTTHIRREMECASACNFMFMGGVVRSVDPGGQFVVHMFDKQVLPEVILLKLMHAKATTDKDIRLARAALPAPRSAPRPPMLPPPLPDLTGGSDAAGKQAPVFERVRQPPAERNGADSSSCPDTALLHLVKDLSERLGDRDTSISVAREVYKLAKDFVDPALCDEYRAMLDPMTDYVLTTEQDDARTAAEIARFLVDMSLSLRFLTQFANIPNHHPRALTRDELRDFNIVNTE